MAHRPFLLAVPILLACGAAQAQAPGANTAPAAVEAGHYVVEPNHTEVEFRVNHMGFSLYNGRFDGASGELTLDPSHPAASAVSVSAPVASVSTTSATLDGELKGADWLDAKAFPTMTFKSTDVTVNGAADATVAGQMTIHGISRPATLKVHFIGSGVNPLSKAYTVGFVIEGDLKRSDFGVTRAASLISDAVHLSINGAFEKK